MNQERATLQDFAAWYSNTHGHTINSEAIEEFLRDQYMLSQDGEE